MKKVMAYVMAVLLLLGCVCAHAEENEDLTEVRCDEWHFSVGIPSGMKTTSYDCENTEFEVLDGGGLRVSPEGTGGMPQVWILRRDHAFNNPPLYLTDFFWQYLHDDSDEIFDEVYSLNGEKYDLFDSIKPLLDYQEKTYVKEVNKL